MSSEPSPASLRDTYHTPSVSWKFNKPTSHSASNATSSHTHVDSSAIVSSLSKSPSPIKWGTPSSSGFTFSEGSNASFIGTPPSSYTGSSYASGSYPYGKSPYASVGYHSGSPRVALKALLASAFLQYTMTAIAMPWEVGKVLLQVQWVPKRLEGGLAAEYQLELELELEEEEENDELSDSSTDDSYFHDPTSPTRQSRQARARPLPRPRKQSTDILTAKARLGISPLIISYGPADGVWGMMRRVRLWRTEGWGSLWKGLLTSVTLSLLTSTIQPSIASFLRPMFPSSQLVSPLLLPLTSHLVTGIILSPLDTLRTLQIIHPRPSPSPFTHFSLLTSNANSEIPITLGALYTHPTLLLPAILDNTLRPLITLLMPRMIERFTGVRIGVNVWMYPLCEFVGGVIGLGLTIPIETIRRRLQAQIVAHGLSDPKSKGSPTRATNVQETDGRVTSCVHLSPRPYKGMLDCLWRILTEERSGPPPLNRKRRRPSMKSPRPSNVTVTPTPKSRKKKGRISGGTPSTSRRGDVKGAFDDPTPRGHRPGMLSDELRRASSQRYPDEQPEEEEEGVKTRGERLRETVEQELEKAKEEISEKGVEAWIDGTGIGQLYRGFGMGVGALALVLVLGLITGEETEGWAEI